MKQSRLFALVWLCILGIVNADAQVKTEKRETMYIANDMSCYGTETRPYIMDERGAKKVHGTYLFTGSGEQSSSRAELKVKYNISAACDHGNLHGPIKISSQCTGKYYEYYKGWISVNAGNKLEGNFSHGSPNGTFNIVLNNGSWKLTATMKNNHFVGPFYVYGLYKNAATEMKGQFDQNGKMTGTWQVGNDKTMQFVNNVHVNLGTPDVQAMAKQYAEGKITEEKMHEKGYYLAEDSIKTRVVVDYILDSEFNFSEMPVNYSLTSYYYNVHYKYVFKLNMLTEEGLGIILDAIDKQGYPFIVYEGKWRQHGDVKCWSSYHFDPTYQAYYLDCMGGFTWDYGTIQQQDFKIYITEEQRVRLQDAMENVYPRAARPFAEILIATGLRDVYDLYIQYTDKTPDFNEQFANLAANNRTNYIENSEKLANSIPDTASIPYYRLSRDGKYVIRRLGGIYQNDKEILDSMIVRLRWIDDQIKQLSAASDSILNVQETVPARVILQNAFKTLGNGKGYTDRLQLLSDVRDNMSLVDSMMKDDAILRTKLEGKELSAYEKMKKEVEKSKVKDGNSFSNFVSLLKSFRAEQQSYLSLLECRTIAQGKQQQVETNNAEILALSAPLKDVAKVYAGNVKTFSSVRPSLGSMEDVKATIANYTQILEQQSAMLGYLRQRKQVVDLDSKILSSLAASKKCTKAYQTLLKVLPLDEQSVSATLEVLKTLSAKVATIDVTGVESSLKNAKTPEQIKAAFGM